MRTNCRKAAVVSAAVLAAFAIPAGAQTAATGPSSLAFSMTPVSDVVSQFHHTFGASIVIRPGISPERRVSFTVPNTDQAGAAVETVQDLANALGADWQKTFVVSRATSDDMTAPLIDSEAPVKFKSTEMPAEDAIRAVASVDGATVQFYSPVEGTVHFSDTDLTAKQAAREIAQQTHLLWKTFYALAPRRTGSVPLGAKVIGRTSSGRPILELPSRSYVLPPKAPEETAQQAEPTTTDQTAANQTNTDQNAANQAAAQQMGQYGYNPFAYGYNPYGYNPYGYNPYGYGYFPYGYYGSPGYNVGGGVTVLPGSPYSGAPIVFGNQ